MFQIMLKILQDVDKYFIITQVKGEDKSEAILQPSDISSMITKIWQYFDRLFPNTKVRNLNPGISVDVVDLFSSKIVLG